MTSQTVSTRRSLLKGGAILAAPLAIGPAAAMADDGLKARLARLEDQAAIRDLHQTWLRRANTGPRGLAFDPSVSSIRADNTARPDKIDLAADGLSASGRFGCEVVVETALSQDCTLAQMAHAQGSGGVRRTEFRTLRADYVKSGGAWTIATLGFEPI